MFPIYVRYALFAVFATLTNIGAQIILFRLYDGPYSLPIAIIIGTGAGLVTKYVLDKHWIFYDTTTGVSAHGKRFSLYTATGVGTTAIFWSMEYAFDALTPDGRYRYVGAVIGLSIGYITKYQLDRRFVFDSRATGAVRSGRSKTGGASNIVAG